MIERALCVFLVASLGATLGCTAPVDTSNIIDSEPIPTEVVVDPGAFLGEIPCDPRPGAMQSYVATLIDHGFACTSEGEACTDPTECCSGSCNGLCTGVDPPPPEPLTLPSSLPTSCSQAIFFRYVVTDHVYTAEIDAYTAPADDLFPRDGVSSGTRTMVLANNPGVTVDPTWKTTCTDQVIATLDSVVAIGDCEGLSAPPGQTEIRVDPLGSLGSLACVSEGTILEFKVVPEDASLGPQHVSCPPTADKEYATYSGVLPGVEYAFVVEAYETGAAPAWRASCYAVAEEGFTAFASCDHLAPIP